MFAHNTVRLTGNVGGDPEIRHFDSGTQKASFSIAVYSGAERPSEWFDVEAWGKTADRVAEQVSKGCKVSIAGCLKQERWQDKESGANRSKVIVKAQSIDVLAKHPATASNEDIPY